MAELRSARTLAALAAIVALASACGPSDDDGAAAQQLAVVSAFPAELAPLVERATIEETVDVDGRRFRLGTLGGTRVVLALTGIGLVNAESTTRTLLETFPVSGVVMSGVAGSLHRIADVAVPEGWKLVAGETVHAVDAAWLEVARELAAPGAVPFESCTLVSDVTSEPVCLEHEPAIFVGGVGESEDPFNGAPLPCDPDGDDVFGCDVDASPPATTSAADRAEPKQASPYPVAIDMETAAVARVAAEHGLPFIAFRAVSDGEGDPLGLPGFPAQFFAYYPLAAANAAAATAAFLERVGG